MNFSHYEKEALKYRLPQANETYAVLGLVGEIGELYGAWAKNVRDETNMDEEAAKKELGDILWFVAAICQDLDCTLAEVAQMNIDKLSKRASKGTLRGSGDNR